MVQHEHTDPRGDVRSSLPEDSAPRSAEDILELAQFACDNAADAAFWMGPDARFLYVNEQACRSLEYTRDELLSMSVHDIDPRVSAERWPALWTRVRQEQSFVMESVHRAKTGRAFPVEIAANYLEFRGREYNCCFARDITERKEAEEYQDRLIAELEAKNAELERFAYGVSHDLRSPLITICGYLGCLREDLAGGNTAEVEASMTMIADAAGRMQQMLDEILALSRIGRTSRPATPVAMLESAYEAVGLLRGPIAERGVRVNVSPDLPSVQGDRLRLTEVWQNLIENSVKYMGDQPEPTVDLAVRRDDEGPVFYVRDNGIGIDPAHRERVFTLFGKLDPCSEGTGVGLALVKRIVEVHGGRIWVESQGPGRGSTFCFTVPEPSPR